MSIRLRLTMLYTAILALTLIGFGAVLYGTQAQTIHDREEQMLASTAQRIAEARQSGSDWVGQGQPPPMPPPDGERPGQRQLNFRSLYIQLLGADGEIIFNSESEDQSSQTPIPLSEAGMQVALSGESWTGTAWIENERLLIYSTPVVVDGQVVEVVQVAQPLTEQDQHLDVLESNLLIVGGAALLVAFGAGWVMSGLVLRPVNRITQTAHDIGVERDFGRRVDHSGPNDEIGRLATTFNEMLGELQAAYQQQRQFVADVSHELRTPLTTIRGNLDLLRREPAVGAEEQADILEDVTEESDRLIRLVNDLLALAHAESGRQLRSEAVRVKPLIEDVRRQARLLDPGRAITCDDAQDLAVIGDQDALRQVLLILVDNALKHTAGAITVSAEAAENRVALRVGDAGPGIEIDELDRIFERFYRGRGTSDEPSIGLGLAIAKALIEAQDGEIAVESQADQGSIFSIILPQAAIQD
ncbi:MAG: HAMP domain-containing histidine kinase [Anaerolineae bacterium]|nr:HAMP domain-containing histidine kinase [Anaerolineae bacterium]